MQNKIITIQGKKSEWYEQAIFILKQDKAPLPMNLVLEAEKIINSYMERNRLTPKPIEKKAAYTEKKTAPTILKKEKGYLGIAIMNICLILCCVLLGFMLRGLLI